MATFECETSEPFVKVKWFKDGIEIHSGDKYRMHSDRKAHFLSVLAIEMSDADDYSCALVEDESIKTTAKLTVEGKKEAHSSVPRNTIKVKSASRGNKPI